MSTNMQPPATPNLDRTKEAQARGSQQIGEFLDWLVNEAGFRICELRGELYEVPEHTMRVLQTARWYGSRLWLSATIVYTVEDMLLRGFNGRATATGIMYDEERVPAVKEWIARVIRDGAFREEDNPTTWTPLPGSVQDLLARYFGIDPDEAERERMALLEYVRSQA